MSKSICRIRTEFIETLGNGSYIYDWMCANGKHERYTLTYPYLLFTCIIHRYIPKSLIGISVN